MKKTSITAVVAVAVTFSAAGVYAGHKNLLGAPYVSSTYAIAAMGDSRASADTTAQALCSTVSVLANNSLSTWCQICDASSNCKSCFTSASSAAQTIASITDSSWLMMYFDANGNCTQLQVENSSSFLPMTP
jgi:hypothetical protein